MIWNGRGGTVERGVRSGWKEPVERGDPLRRKATVEKCPRWVLRGAGLLLATSLSAVEWNEAWQGLESCGELEFAWGLRHIQIERNTGEEVRVISTADMLLGALPPGDRCWMLCASGAWRAFNAGGWCSTWQCGGPIVDYWPDEGGRNVWVAESGRLLKVEADFQPLIIEQLSLAPWQPDPTSPPELRGAGGRLWLRLDLRIYYLDRGTLRLAGELPPGHRGWYAAEKQVLLLDAEGRLVELDEGGPGSRHRLEEDVEFTRLWALPCVTWIEDAQGALWRHPEGKPAPECLGPPPPAPEVADPPDLLPLDERRILVQGSCRRDLLSWMGGGDDAWSHERHWRRPLRTLQRQFRWDAEWRLQAEGLLLRLSGGEARPVGVWPDARILAWAGGGPLLILEDEILAFSEGGALLGTLAQEGLVCAMSREDYLLACDEDSLYSFWTGEELPWLQSAITLPGIRELRTGLRWLAARGSGEVHLVDCLHPWSPQWVDSRELPDDCGDMLVVEDRLLLCLPEGLEVWDLAQGCLADWSEPHLAPPCARLCRRAADRLLMLEDGGRLIQAGLLDGAPRTTDWEQWLPMTGEMQVWMDSLRLVSEAGWMDLPLPPLDETRLSAGGSSDPWDRVLMIRPNPGNGAFQVQMPAGAGRTWRLELYDLLGRLHIQQRAQGASTRLDLSGNASGTYLLRLRSLGDDGGNPVELHGRIMLLR